MANEKREGKGLRMRIKKEDIEHLCWLARIELSDDEKEKFAAQLSEILEYFSILDEADTSDVEPMFHAVGVENVMREDVPEESLEHEDALMNAPKKEKGYFKSPRIL